MPNLIKNGNIIEDTWSVVPEDSAPDFSQGQWLLSLSQFLKVAESTDLSRIGVALKNDDDVSMLAKYSSQLTIISVNFPSFMDGRAFTQARTLREQLEFTGELRVTGHFIEDQLFYLCRCGVDAFAPESDMDIERVRERLAEFTDTYQAAIDDSQPLFRRRA